MSDLIINPDSIFYGNQFIRSYKTGANQSIGVKPIQEFGVITIRNLIGGQAREITLSAIPYSIQFLSFYGYQGTGANAQIVIDILQGSNIVSKVNLNSASLPYAFPENCINTQFYTLRITPTANINICHFFYERSYIIDLYEF